MNRAGARTSASIRSGSGVLKSVLGQNFVNIVVVRLRTGRSFECFDEDVCVRFDEDECVRSCETKEVDGGLPTAANAIQLHINI